MSALHFPEVLTFVESAEEWSLYRTVTGETAYLQHGTGVRLVALSEINLDSAWSGWSLGQSAYDREGFRDYLRGISFEHDEIDDISWCDDCSALSGDDSYTLHNGDSVCSSCVDEYYLCNDCEEFHSSTNTIGNREVCSDCTTNGEYSFCDDCDEYVTWNDSHSIGDDTVCESCLDRNYSYCDRCEEYSSNNDPCDCGRECDYDCSSPAQYFTVRNDGDSPLENDTRTTVSLPAGVISAEGIGAIALHLRYGTRADPSHDAYMALSMRLSEIGDKWQAKDGNYTKRLSRFAYKNLALKVSPDVLSEIGNIASAHSTAVSFHLETTRDLNQSAESFCHGESCWWTDYARASRCALKSQGGFGLRTFSQLDNGYGFHNEPTGRAWVMPLRFVESDTPSARFLPTFDTMSPDAFIVFNGYGALTGYGPARILAHMAGMTYRKVALDIDGMYINGDTGYLVAPEDIASQFTDGRVWMIIGDEHVFNGDMSEKLVSV